MDLKKLYELCNEHDYTYMMSNDGRVYKNGQVESDTIKNMVGYDNTGASKALYDAFNDYWWKGAEKPEKPA